MSQWFRKMSSARRQAQEELYSTGYTGWMFGCGRFLLVVLVFAIVGGLLHAIVPLIAIGVVIAFIVSAILWSKGRL